MSFDTEMELFDIATDVVAHANAQSLRVNLVVGICKAWASVRNGAVPKGLPETSDFRIQTMATELDKSKSRLNFRVNLSGTINGKSVGTMQAATAYEGMVGSGADSDLSKRGSEIVTEIADKIRAQIKATPGFAEALWAEHLRRQQEAFAERQAYLAAMHANAEAQIAEMLPTPEPTPAADAAELSACTAPDCAADVEWISDTNYADRWCDRHTRDYACDSDVACAVCGSVWNTNERHAHNTDTHVDFPTEAEPDEAEPVDYDLHAPGTEGAELTPEQRELIERVDACEAAGTAEMMDAWYEHVDQAETVAAEGE